MNKSMLDTYRQELQLALKWQSRGDTEVHSAVAGYKLAKGRFRVPIEEYIKYWQDGIAAMEAGADQSKFVC